VVCQMNKETFYCGTCKATKNKQSPLFLVKFDQKNFPKIYPNQRLSTIRQKNKQMSYLDICFASMNWALQICSPKTGQTSWHFKKVNKCNLRAAAPLFQFLSVQRNYLLRQILRHLICFCMKLNSGIFVKIFPKMRPVEICNYSLVIIITGN
jgi:hypothetical protein